MKSDSARQELTREEALELYYYMRLNRSLDELLVRLFRQNKIVGGLYGSLGQEATSIGTAYALAQRRLDRSAHSQCGFAAGARLINPATS